jgi:hypothetical protein
MARIGGALTGLLIGATGMGDFLAMNPFDCLTRKEA